MSRPEDDKPGVLSGELPWAEGEHAGPDVYDPHIDFDAGRWTFTGVSKEYTLYSSVVLNHLGLTFDPVALCWEENGFPLNETPIALEASRPLLSGLPPPLDRTLFACPAPYAEELIRFLDRICVCRDGAFYESQRQMIPVVDWPLLDKMSVAPPRAPTVLVALYGVTGGGSTVYWKPPANPWKDALSLVRRVKKPDTKRGKS